jgi:disulfide bond formation protein DsbB
MARASDIAESRTAEKDKGRARALPWAWGLLVLSAIAVAGSLSMSLGLGLKACALCFYQRTFVMALFANLLVGLLADRTRAGLYCLLSLPLVFGGLGVAAFHTYVVLAGKLECPNGFFELGAAPFQSLAIFILLTAVVLLGAWAGRQDVSSFPLAGALGAALLGLLLAWGSIASSPASTPRTSPYDPVKEPLNICRPPYRPS